MICRRVGVLAAAATTLALLVSACSSSGDGSADGTSTSGPSGTAIRVGAVGTYSGAVASSIASAKSSVQAWADELNASGGINGHPVKLYLEDDAGSVSQALTAVKTLVEQDHVVAIVGQASGNASTWADYIKKKGIPVVGGNPGEASSTKNDDFFSIGGNPLATFYGVSAAAKDYGTKFGELYCAELPACANTIGLFKAFGKSTGVDLTYSTKVAASAPDFVAPCQGLKDSGVQSYILSLAAATQANVAGTCKQQGLNARLIVSGQTADQNMLSNSAFADAVIVSPIVPFMDETSPATKAMHAALAKYAPSLGSKSNPLNQHAIQGYISGKLFEAAVKASGASDVTPETVKQGLYALKGETLAGLTVPLTYVAGKPSLFNCYYVTQIRNGQMVAPGGPKPKCAPSGVVEALLKG